MLKVGVSQQDITPAVGLNMPGYFDQRLSSGILDPLYAKACVFDDGETVFAFVVCDAMELYRKHALQIRRLASEQTGIPEDNISVSVTHSHTTGPTWTWEDAYEEDEAYTQTLVTQAAKAVREAFDNRCSAKMGFVRSELHGVAFIRRFYMKDGTFTTCAGNAELVDRAETEPDETFILIKIEREDGSPLAFIENFALHADSVGENKISADYPGEVSRLVREAYGETVMNLFINSAGGDVNHVNIHDKCTREVGYHKQIGRLIFEKLQALSPTVDTSADISLASETMYFTTEKRKPGESVYTDAVSFLASAQASAKKGGAAKIFAIAAKHCYESHVKEIEVEIKAVRIGELYVAVWPGEVFCEFAKCIRAAFPDQVIAISAQANNTLDCYIPSRIGFENGGYEPRVSVERMSAETVGYEIVENTKTLIQALR